ncbi:MAG: hypothetical protein AB7G28_14130 [Pirellulales bacterium]
MKLLLPLIHGVAVALTVLSFLEGKNLPLFVYSVGCIGGLIAAVWSRDRCRQIMFAVSVSSILFVFLPIDFSVRQNKAFAARVVPAVYDFGYRQHIRDLNSSGLRENRDFVVVSSGMPIFPRTKYSLLVLIPGD